MYYGIFNRWHWVFYWLINWLINIVRYFSFTWWCFHIHKNCRSNWIWWHELNWRGCWIEESTEYDDGGYEVLSWCRSSWHSYISGSDHEDVVIMLFGLFLLCYQLKYKVKEWNYVTCLFSQQVKPVWGSDLKKDLLSLILTIWVLQN